MNPCNTRKALVCIQSHYTGGPLYGSPQRPWIIDVNTLIFGTTPRCPIKSQRRFHSLESALCPQCVKHRRHSDLNIANQICASDGATFRSFQSKGDGPEPLSLGRPSPLESVISPVKTYLNNTTKRYIALYCKAI